MFKKIGSIAGISILLISNLCTSPAMAAGCNSPINTTRKIWNKWDNVIIATGCVAATTISTGALGLAASLECIKKADKFAKAAEKAVQEFNSALGDDDSRLRIGPRPIVFQSAQEGALIGPIDRTFLSAYPMDKNNITVSVKKLDGRANTEIVICKVSYDGTATKVGELNFERGNDNVGKSQTTTVSGMENHLLQVRINTITPLFGFKYQLKASK
jgi:hypothetical protein